MKKAVANTRYLSGLPVSRNGYQDGGVPSLSDEEVDRILGGGLRPVDLARQSMERELTTPTPAYQEQPWYQRAYDAATGAVSSAAQNYLGNVARESKEGRDAMFQANKPGTQILGATQAALAPLGGAARSVGDLTTYLTGNPEAGRRAELVSSFATPGSAKSAKYLDYALPRKSGGRISSYPLRDKKDWTKHGNYAETGGAMNYISPDRFLSETEKMDMDGGDKKHIKKFKKKIKKGERLNPLALFPSGGQDGRHRAKAAKALGISKIPVITWPARKD